MARLEQVTINRKEQERLEMFRKVRAGEPSRREAAEAVGLFHRRYGRSRAAGGAGLTPDTYVKRCLSRSMSCGRGRLVVTQGATRIAERFVRPSDDLQRRFRCFP